MMLDKFAKTGLCKKRVARGVRLITAVVLSMDYGMGGIYPKKLEKELYYVKTLECIMGLIWKKAACVIACAGLFEISNAQILAFPEALGFGATVTGGRGGSVYHVTNLNDSGTGSFRDAVSAGNRIVVFDVGGIINIKTAVSIKSNITIAGQTAPGEGIAIHGGKLSTGKQSNIIIRYLRIRPGENTASEKDDALNLYDSKNIIVDHCSVELAPWNNFGGSSDNADYRVTGVTVQNTLVANPIGQQFGAHIESVDGTWSWYYNAFVNSHNRNPLDKINDVFVNNVLYNFEAGYTTHTSTKFKHDIVNNYFVYGPTGKNEWFQFDKNQTVYASGNMLDKNKDGKLNGEATSIYYYQGAGTELDKPWNEMTSKNPLYSAATAWRLVNSQSGVLPYDDIDSLVWYQMSTLGSAGKLVQKISDMGLKTNDGWGEVIAGKAETDSDKDGMPDYFEKAMGYDSAKDDAMNKAQDGYVYIEKYINWLGAMHMKATAGQTADFDLRSITRGFQGVAPTYKVAAVQGEGAGGSVQLLSDGYTARFSPQAGTSGLAAFSYTVNGNDGTEYTGRVEVLVEPGDAVPASSSAQSSNSAQLSSSSSTNLVISSSTDPQSSAQSVSSSAQSSSSEPTESLAVLVAAPATFDLDHGVVYAVKDGRVEVCVFDLAGRVVAKYSGNVRAGMNAISLKKSLLPVGEYKTQVRYR